ncbi:MAG TPA: hypothetical protein VFX49_21695 [Chloroflexota bacterium]|nr:hypothetical protein [Chloroflexota bacterium]
MAVLVGVFENEGAAERAYVRLRETGVPEDSLALISNVRQSTVQTRPTSAAEMEAERQSDAISIQPAAGLEMADPADGDAEGMRDRPAEHVETAPETSDNPGLDAAALGAAIGALAGGGAAGPFGAVAGAAIGTGIGAFFASRGVGLSEATRYEDALREGRYLVAVETDNPTPEMRAVLDVSGAAKVEVEAA